MLITSDEWLIKRNNLYGHLGLPQDPHAFLDPVIEQLDQSLAALAQAVEEGKVWIDTAIHLDPLVARPEDLETDRLRRAIFEAHPPGQFPEIILEIDSPARFGWILLGREPRSKIELLMAYSAILAHGTSLSAADISRMVPEVSPAAIHQMMKRFEDERMLRRAADAVLEFMHEHPVAAYWGRADLASSDMMSLETTRTALAGSR